MAKWYDENDKEVTDPEILKKLGPPPEPKAPESDAWRGVRGFTRGLAGFETPIMRAAQPLVETVTPNLARAIKPYGRQLEQFAKQPTTGIETLGRGAGEVAPFIYQPALGVENALGQIGTRALPYVGRFIGGKLLPGIGKLAEDALWGGTSAGLQPTDKDTLEEHEENYKRGLVAGVGAGAARGVSRTLTSPALNLTLAHHLGTHFGINMWPLYFALHHTGIGNRILGIINSLARPGIAGPASTVLKEDDGRNRPAESK